MTKNRQRRCKGCETLLPRDELNKLVLCADCTEGYEGSHKRSRCKGCDELFDPTALNVDSFCWACLGLEEPAAEDDSVADDYEPPCGSCFQYGCWGCDNGPPKSRIPAGVKPETRKRRK